MAEYKRDWKRFSSLRKSVHIRYQEVVDMSEYEPKIAKLLDDHVVAQPAEVIVEQVNLNDPEALQRVIEESGTTAASKADRIASATKKTITERMDTDPAFYKKFSEMLEETIRAYREKRLSEKEYLRRITEIAQNVAEGRRRDDVPPAVREDDDAQAFYGVLTPLVAQHLGDGDHAKERRGRDRDRRAQHRQGAPHRQRVAKRRRRKPDANAIDDYFFDVVGPNMGIEVEPSELDAIERELMRVARARFPQ